MNQPAPAPVPLPDLDPRFDSPFVATSGLHLIEYDGSRVVGRVDCGPEHHTPWGVVHGGAHCSIVESAGPQSPRSAARSPSGVNNTTDLLRSESGGSDTVEATPTHQGRSQHLWQVTIHHGGTLLSRGTARLHNIDASPLLPTPLPRPLGSWS